MSQYSREQILKMIEANGGPKRLNLREADLSSVDLDDSAIEQELVRWRKSQAEETPVWYSLETKGINLRGANLQDANLQGARLNRADLKGAILHGADLQKVRLLDASLQGAALVEAKLQKANLRRASLQKAILWNAKLDGETILFEANLERADLRWTYLERVDLSQVVNLRGVRWHNAFLDRTWVNWKELVPIGEEMDKQWEEAKEAYLLLKDNFNDLGHYDYAREAYIKEREMERKAHWPLWRAQKYYAEDFNRVKGNSLLDRFRRLQFYLKYTGRHDVWVWSLLTFFKFTSMYGQNPLRVFLSTFSGAIWIVLFGLFYQSAGVVSLSSGGKALSWPQALIYSFASFATLELSDYQAVTLSAQFLTSLESLLGIVWIAFWLGYFVFAFTNMMRSS